MSKFLIKEPPKNEKNTNSNFAGNIQKILSVLLQVMSMMSA
jgi:hypothetical protein